MGLLEDFETLEKQQTDSIEYYLYQLVLRDKHPINIDIRTYKYAKNIEPQSIKQDRVYIVVCGDNILIGVHPVLKEIELKDFWLYLELYTKQYPSENIKDFVDWPLWSLIYAKYTHSYDMDFVYNTNNWGTIDSRYSRRNYRIKFQQPTPTHTEAYEKYIPTIKIDYSK